MDVPKERLIFIDALRGYAILMMLQGHTIGVVLQEKYRDPSLIPYLVWRYLTGLTAPVFFLAAGLIFAFLMARAELHGGTRLQKGLKRGGWLMVLGWVLQLWPPILVDFAKGDWVALGRIFGKSHVLHTIGWALIIMVVLWLVSGRRGKVFGILALVLSQAALLIGPLAEQWQPDSGVARLVATFVSKEFAVFPILPWVGYSLMGGALGALAWQTKWYRQSRNFVYLMAVGLVLMFGNQLITGAFWGLVGGVSDADLSQFAGRYWRAGEVLFFTGLMGLFCRFLVRKGWEETLPVRVLTTCGKETLTIYFLHVFVVYSVVFGIGLSAFFKREFGPWGSVAAALLVQTAFILLAMNLQKWRIACPPLRLLR